MYLLSHLGPYFIMLLVHLKSKRSFEANWLHWRQIIQSRCQFHFRRYRSSHTCKCRFPLSRTVLRQHIVSRDAVIQESLRIHGNLGLVNERVTPPEGAFIDGYHIPGGTIVGINPWVIHRNAKIFGDDVDDFRPERWLDGDGRQIAEMRRNLFSVGRPPL